MFGNPKVKGPVFGLLAEYEDGNALLDAIRHGRSAGYERMEAYTPLPMHEVFEALGDKNRLPLLVLFGGIAGAVTGFALQYWSHVIHYPYNIGGRPLNSWPSFIVVMFELTILFAALTAVFGMLLLNGLPRPHHPVFDVPGFEEASHSRFFLLVPAYDPEFHMERTKQMLSATATVQLSEVPNP